MNYPIEGLTWIAPILFIVLMIGFPVIGVFGGWKRAVYWGGGNFVFYVIGLLIWTFAGNAIVEPIKPLIQQLLEQTGKTIDVTNITISILAPVFFIIVLLLGNLILLINYYAWFKKVSGIKKVVKEKRKDNKGNVYIVKVNKKQQLSTTGKVVNMVVGGVAMTALMLPTTFAFTEAVSMATTSAQTRTTNKFSAGVHDALVATDEKMNWFSYYSGSAKDFDALFGTLAMMNTQVEIKLPNDEGTTFTGTALEALGEVLDKGIGGIFEWTTASEAQLEMKDMTKVEAVLNKVNDMADSWNSLIEQAGMENMASIFNSENATKMVKEIIGIDDTKSPEHINKSNIGYYIGENSDFAMIVKYYEQGSYPTKKEEIKTVKHMIPIDVNQQCYDNIAEAVWSSYIFDDDLSPEEIQAFKDRMNQLINIMFI